MNLICGIAFCLVGLIPAVIFFRHSQEMLLNNTEMAIYSFILFTLGMGVGRGIKRLKELNFAKILGALCGSITLEILCFLVLFGYILLKTPN
jgi:hypothetical protein